MRKAVWDAIDIGTVTKMSVKVRLICEKIYNEVAYTAMIEL